MKKIIQWRASYFPFFIKYYRGDHQGEIHRTCSTHGETRNT